MRQARIRTTVAIAQDLLEAVDRAVVAGAAGSRNDFLALALRNQLARARRAAIDEAFAGMASDPIHQRESAELAQELAASDWEAFRIAEGGS